MEGMTGARSGTEEANLDSPTTPRFKMRREDASDL